MNIGQLKRLIEALPDNTPVLHPTHDHSYNGCSANTTTAIYVANENYWSEDFDGQLNEGEVRRNVLVIS